MSDWRQRLRGPGIISTDPHGCPFCCFRVQETPELQTSLCTWPLHVHLQSKKWQEVMLVAACTPMRHHDVQGLFSRCAKLRVELQFSLSTTSCMHMLLSASQVQLLCSCSLR